jgi:hypothetical protein
MDLTPPWVADEVRAAQAFIDQAWAEHVHDTEHVFESDWQLGDEFILHNDLGDVLAVHLACRYCHAAAAESNLRKHLKGTS